MKQKLAAALESHVDLQGLRASADALLASGRDADEVVAEVVTKMDAAIPWAAILGTLGPVGSIVGTVVDLADGPIATMVARGIVRSAARARARRAGSVVAIHPGEPALDLDEDDEGSDSIPSPS